MQEEQIEEFEQQPNTWARVFRGVVALAVAIGLIYISGVHQYFFFQRTSPNVEQEQTQTAVDAEQLQVPITIFILKNENTNGSRRTKEDAQRLVEQADRIWEQASIDLIVKNVHVLETTDQEIQFFFAEPRAFAQTIKELDLATINVFLVGNLQGLNGISFGGISVIAVADYTTVYDFRTFAHEVGHQLGLGHIRVDEGRLMFQGANGFELSLEEIMRAREFAERFSN